MKLFVVACALHFRGIGIHYAPFDDIVRRFELMCRGIGLVDYPNKMECLVIAHRLEEIQLLECYQSAKDRYPTIELKIQTEDIQFATENDQYVKKTSLFNL